MLNRSSDNQAGFSSRGLRRLPLVILALLVGGVALVVFLPGLNGQFLNWDDDRNFLANEAYRGVGMAQWSWAWKTFHLGVWQPLAWMLYGVEYTVGRLNPREYHAFSITIHALNSVIFYLLTLTLLRCRPKTDRTLAPTKSDSAAPIIAAAAALLFAVHPLRVEAVAWVSCQPYLPCALFFMLTILTHVRGYAPPNAGPSEKQSTFRPRTWISTFLCFIIAILFKAPAVVLPILLLLLDLYPLNRFDRRLPGALKRGVILIVEKLPFIAIAAVSSYWAMRAKDFNESRVPFSDWSAGERLAQSAYGYAFYLVKTVWPTDLSPYYELPANLSFTHRPYLAASALIIVITLVALAFARSAPALITAWLAYLIILAPNVGLVQISQQIAADRYAYIATLPLFILLAVIVHMVFRKSKVPRPKAVIACALLAAAAVVGLSVITRARIADWSNSVALWRRSVAVNPDCAHSQCQLGQALAVESELSGGNNHDRFLSEAADHLRKSVSLRKDFAFAYSNLGAVLLKQQAFTEAEKAYLSAVALAPYFTRDELAKVYAGLALTEGALGKTDAAWKHLYEASKLGLPKAQQRIIAEAI